MRIAVLNGSPRGGKSVGIKSALFLQKKFPQHEFEILDVGIRIRHLESDIDAFQDVVDKVRASDGVLW
jgi:NAD(P)H-dependent FMN reductase